MTEPLIDLRSDTVTRPSAEMREAMALAEVGDDVYGEDPTVRTLEARVAELLGKEAAVFVPSGTMANQLAIGAQAGPGDEVIGEAGSHVFAFEGGALSALWGAQARTLEGERGLLRPEQVEAAIRPTGNDHLPLSRLLSLENTHNRGGGTVWPIERFQAVAGAARKAGLAVHLDGARLWNASVASGVPLSRYASEADTVSVCLSKGLGAPAGSLVAASAALCSKVRRLRKRLGGGMRQAGVLAAAGLYALDHHLVRLHLDHENARLLADALEKVPGLRVDPVETNLVFVDLPAGTDGAGVLSRLREKGVLAGSDGASRLRLVTHLDVDRDRCMAAAAALAACL
ncbi:threonine aldolase family protein [Vulgatibacter incomptus]|uniref:Low-specificity L-threonine aldolase n=1 Tax=Vulgatibacter incomptus TaxID=1391653 RepID=A0A0K1PE31_9BACT|nr:GntG family PLP-dependent aldolase [Vulgatibacter incomptus]AKU91793.1 Low-specificity L-threonine aldolase [Vulgatibacter incomptus]